MNFGGALECLKRGMKVQREGWGDCFLQLQKQDDTMYPYLLLVVPITCNVPWNPTQSDMLAEDWNLV